MKRVMACLSVLVLALSAVPTVFSEEASMQAATLVMDRMPAGSSAQVESVLRDLPGVSLVKVDEAAGLAVVVYAPAQVQQEEFPRAMQSAGFLATFARANFRCTTCPATYAENGTCIVDGGALEAIS